MLSIRRWRSVFFIPLLLFASSLVILLGSVTPATSQAGAASSGEIRGVWVTNVDSEIMFNDVSLEAALEQLAQLNFNTVYPAVWNWGYTLYRSQTAERTIGYAIDPRVPMLMDYDVLSAIVDRGHQKGLTVIPWFEFGFMAPADSEIVQLHPDWITTRQDGTQIWQDGIYQRCWLNPFKPEVQQFIQTLILEIVTQYNIDGIQFDDHFGLPDEFGYDPFTVQLYQQEHGGKSPPKNLQDPTWIRWRADKITQFMTQVFHAIKARKPNIIVSLSPNNYRYAYHHSLQDWRTWERQGLVEELILQLYGNSLEGFAAELTRPEVQAAKQHIPTAIGILTGLKDRLVGMQQIQSQVQLTRNYGFSGVSFFFYETLWNLAPEPAIDRQNVLRSLFSIPVQRPNLLRGWRVGSGAV